MKLFDAITFAIELIPYTYYCTWLEFLCVLQNGVSSFIFLSDDRMIDVWSASSSSSSSRNRIAHTHAQDVRRNEEKEEIEKRVQQMSKMYFACIKSSFVIINNCYFAAIPIRVIFISELQMHAFVVYDMRMHKSVSH